MNAQTRGSRICGTPRLVSIALLLSTLFPNWAFGCGSFSWDNPPHSHFSGTDFQGFVFLTEPLGEIELGDRKIPVIATFSSRRESGESSVLGFAGFEVPWLDAKVVQVSPDMFQWDQQDGWFRVFWRDSKNPGVLHGQGGYLAEVDRPAKDMITITADCGDIKAVFHKGRPVELKMQGRTFTYVIENGKPVEVKEGNTSVLKVEKDPSTGKPNGLTVQGRKTIQLDRGQRPIVHVINGQPIVGQVAETLVAVTRADSSKQTFEFGLDAASLNPTLKMGDRLIIWHGASKRILWDSPFSYDVKPGEGQYAKAAIWRKNTETGADEFWYRDDAKGVETTKDLTGIVVTKKHFASGSLAGKLREVTRSIDGKEIEKLRASYGESGKLIREVTTGEGGKPIKEILYDSEGRKVKSVTPEGITSHFYDSFGRPINAKGFEKKADYLMAHEADLRKRMRETYNIPKKDAIRGELAVFLAREADKSIEAAEVAARIYDRPLNVRTQLVVLFSDMNLPPSEFEQRLKRISTDFQDLPSIVDKQIKSLKTYRERLLEKKR